MKKALVVGLDDYPSPNELNGCVNDAIELSALLEANGDGSPNFSVKTLTSNQTVIDAATLMNAITELFSGEAETALFYFAGHGILNDVTNSGYLVTQDGKHPNWGLSLTDVLELANKAHPRIHSSVILLDSCQSGFAGEVNGLGRDGIHAIGKGVTILTACHKEGFAEEAGRHGKFTDILLEGLGGAASDVLGRVTPASLYSHVDQTLGAWWDQRPIYKANVQSFISLRSVPPKVPVEILRRLPEYFPTLDHIFPLNATFEPERGEETERLKSVDVIPENVRVYRELQQCNRHGLIVPSAHEHMWHSAVFEGGCRLTATGAHLRKLAERKKI